MAALFSIETHVRHQGAQAAVIFVHGLNGDPHATWGDFPRRVAAATRVDVFTLGWPAKLTGFIADAGHTAPLVARAIAQALPALLAPYRSVQLTLHCLGAPMIFDALQQASEAGLVLPRMSSLLLDAPLLAPVEGAPAWIDRAVSLIGFEANTLAARAAWFHKRHGALCLVLRGCDADWVDCCSPFAVGEPKNQYRLPLDHLALAAAPATGEHAPTDLVLAQLAPHRRPVSSLSCCAMGSEFG